MSPELDQIGEEALSTFTAGGAFLTALLVVMAFALPFILY